MPKLNQRGVLDPLVIVLLVIVFALGSYVAWTIFGDKEETDPVVVETSQEVEAEEEPAEIEKSVEYVSYDKIGLQLALPEGWTTGEELVNQATDKSEYTISKGGNDLSIVITTEAFLGGFGDCGGTDAFPIFYSESLARDGYHLLGFETDNQYISENLRTALRVVGTDSGNWYTVSSSGAAPSEDPINSSELKAGNTYHQCSGDPFPGFFVDVPVDFPVNQGAPRTSIDVKSSSNSLKSQVESNSTDFQEVLEILDSLKDK